MFLITGGSGLLAGRLAKFLLANHQKVRIVTSEEKINELRSFFPKDSIDVVSIDINDLNSLQFAFKGVNYLLELASPNANECNHNYSKSVKGKILRSKKIAEFALHSKELKKVFYFSSIHVYGESLVKKVTEDSLARPISKYALAHRKSEEIFFNTLKGSKIKVLILRLSNAIGPPISYMSNCWQLVAFDFAKAAVNHNQIKINSNVENSRDFFPISFLEAAILSLSKKEISSGIFNISSFSNLKLIELAEIIKSEFDIITGRKIDISLPSNKDCVNYVQNFNISNDKILNVTNFNPSMLSIEHELRKLIKFLL